MKTSIFNSCWPTFAGWVGRQQSAVITHLVEENRVLKEQLEAGGRRLRVTDGQRRRLAAKGKPLGRKVRRQVATIVTRYDSRMAPPSPSLWIG